MRKLKRSKTKVLSHVDISKQLAGMASASKVLNDTELDARRFMEADDNGDMQLSFDEFFQMQPSPTRKKFGYKQIREWFDDADTDKSGTVSIGEYFTWTLRNAAENHGWDVMSHVFAKYDTDRSGQLTMREFQRACDDTGFGSVAPFIFRTLDPDGSGEISYHELMGVLQANRPKDASTQQMLAAMLKSNYEQAQVQSKAALQAAIAKASLQGSTVDELRTHMRWILHKSGAQVVDIMELFDVDTSRERSIDLPEFRNALRQSFRYAGPMSVMDKLFAVLDEDGTGTIGFDELFEFVKGKRHSLDPRNKQVDSLSLLAADAKYTLEEVAWSEDTLRHLMHAMMTRRRIGPLDLINAWDQNGDRQVTESEFLEQLERMFGDATQLWLVEVKAIARRAFNRMANTTSRDRLYKVRLSAKELELWLRGAPADAVELQPPLKPKKQTPLKSARAAKKDDLFPVYYVMGGKNTLATSRSLPALPVVNNASSLASLGVYPTAYTPHLPPRRMTTPRLPTTLGDAHYSARSPHSPHSPIGRNTLPQLPQATNSTLGGATLASPYAQSCYLSARGGSSSPSMSHAAKYSRR